MITPTTRGAYCALQSDLPGAMFESLKRAAKAITGKLARRYAAAHQRVVCPHCQGDLFLEGRALLNTPGMTLLNLDWAQRSAYILTCEACGRIEWFARRPVRVRA